MSRNVTQCCKELYFERGKKTGVGSGIALCCGFTLVQARVERDIV